MNNKKLIVILMALFVRVPFAAFGSNSYSTGAVYVMSNDARSKAVVVFDRNIEGN